MLKRYEFKGLTYQFEEGEAPAGAVPVEDKPKVKAAEPETKVFRPLNKAARSKAK